MQSIYVDSFDRPDNADINADITMGGSYTKALQEWQIISGKLKAINLASHLITIDSPVLDDPDYYVQAVITTQTSYASGIGVILRYTDSDNYYYGIINTFSQKALIYKRVTGTNTLLGEYSGGYTQGTSYTLKFDVTGTALKLYVNGTERISVTDSDLTLAGKAGLWTDYGNSTFNNLVISADMTKPSIDSFTPNYNQPALPVYRGYGWLFNCLDIQVVTKSDNWNQDQTKRLNEYQALKDLGANYVAIGVPYDNLTKLRNYVADARSKGFSIWFRGHPNAWEGDNSIPVGVSRTHALEDTYRFITQNADLFQNGDAFGLMVEANNANDHGNYTFRTPETSGGSFDYTKYNEFLKNQVAYSNAAFATIGKSVYTFPCSLSLSNLNLDGQILDSGDGGNSSGLDSDDIIDYFGGVLTIDHYMSPSYTDASEYATKYGQDLDKIHAAFPDPIKIMIGEFGYPTNSPATDQNQYDIFAAVIEVMKSKSYILGVNFWVHMGSNTASLFNDASGTIVVPGRLAVNAISDVFNDDSFYALSSIFAYPKNSEKMGFFSQKPALR